MVRFDQEEFNGFIEANGVYGFFSHPVTLKSGRTSHFYANWRRVVEDVYLTEKLVGYLLAFVGDHRIAVDTFYGVPEGATKLGLLAQYTHARSQATFGKGSHVLSMGRAKPKDHGEPSDRYFVGAPKGKTLVLEDVTTTGGSSLTTLQFLKESGIEIAGLLSLTNRMEKRDDGRSVAEAVAEMGVTFYQMSSALDLLPRLYLKLNPGELIGKAIEAEFARYGVEPLELPELA